MSRRLFRDGGPLRIKSVGNDRYNMTVSLPEGDDGRLARECPSGKCSPGYFKVTPGTGITEDYDRAFCPYCRHQAEPNDFATKEQVRYAKERAFREVQSNVDRMIRDSFGLGSSGRRTISEGFISMKMHYTPSAQFPIRRPYESEVQRDVVCPHCTLDQTVFGLATWCSDCGEDIFLTHVSAEIAVTKLMLGDVERRAKDLGSRVAAKDIENCLEDAVSIFEAAVKATVRRALELRGNDLATIDTEIKKIGNSFQSTERTLEQLSRRFHFSAPHADLWDRLKRSFEKRHPVTHNLGVVDKKYLDRAHEVEREGREVRISDIEVASLLEDVYEAISNIHSALIGSGMELAPK